MGPGSLQDYVWPTSMLEGAQVCRIFSPSPSQQPGLYVNENQSPRPEASFSMLQPGSLGTCRAFLHRSLVMAPLSCHDWPEAERAQFLQSITTCGKRTSLKEAEKQEHTAVGDCYKQSRWNMLVLSAMREPPAIPALWFPPQIACTPNPFLKPKDRKKAFAHASESILPGKFSSVRYYLQVQDRSKNIWHSICFLLKPKSFTPQDFPIAPEKIGQQLWPTLPLGWTGAVKYGHLQQQIGTPWIQVFIAAKGTDSYLS